MERGTYRYVIVGAGPAGLQLSYYGHRLNVRYALPLSTSRATAMGYPSHDRRRSACAVSGRGDRLGEPYVPPVKGIEHATGYDGMDVDPAAYAGKQILVIGKGDSAFETGTAVLGTASARQVSVQDAALRAGLHHRRDPTGRRPVRGIHPIHLCRG